MSGKPLPGQLHNDSVETYPLIPIFTIVPDVVYTSLTGRKQFSL